MAQPQQRRSTFDRLDDVLLVAVAVVAVFAVFQVVSWVVGTVMFLVKVAVAVVVVGLALRWAMRARR